MEDNIEFAKIIHIKCDSLKSDLFSASILGPILEYFKDCFFPPSLELLAEKLEDLGQTD